MQTYPSPHSDLRSGVFDLAIALDAYEMTCSGLVDEWLDMALYAEAGRSIAAIRQLGVPVPSLSVLTLQLAIAHAELESMLWQRSSVGIAEARVREVRERHAAAVQALRTAAARLLRND